MVPSTLWGTKNTTTSVEICNLCGTSACIFHLSLPPQCFYLPDKQPFLVETVLESQVIFKEMHGPGGSSGSVAFPGRPLCLNPEQKRCHMAHVFFFFSQSFTSFHPSAAD